jgi:hypothetical protein
MANTDYFNFEDIQDGAYLLTEGLESYNENIRYHVAEFDKLYIRRIRLPDGKGNIIYLLSDNFNNSLKMLTSKSFFLPQTYRKFFYPWLAFGKFIGRRFRMNVSKEITHRAIEIKERTSLIQYPTRFLQKSNENIVFCTSDIYQTILPIMQRFQIKKLMTEFYSEFLSIIMKITPTPIKKKEDKAWNNRILSIDANSFRFKNGAPLKENKENPLFLIYLAFLRTRNLSKLNVDIDILIASGNMFIKFNPARITPDKWPKFKLALFKIMNVNLDDYTNQLSDEDIDEITQTSNEYLTHNIVDNVIKPFTQHVSPATKGVLGDAIDSSLRQQILATDAIAHLTKDAKEDTAKAINLKGNKKVLKDVIEPKNASLIHTNPYQDISDKRQKVFDAIIKDYRPLIQRLDSEELTDDEEDIISEYEDEIKDDVMDIMTNDENVLEEVLDDIQDRIAPLNNINTAPVNSLRDQKLREAQKKIVVKESSIEEILERDANNVPIISENKSNVLKTANQNMHNITFANFDKTYIEKLYTKDLVSCFDMLKDKNSPFYITKIDVKNTSDTLDLKETWTVHLIDENEKKHTIVVDIPIFYQNRFMLIGGNRYIIIKQNFYNPLVKDTPDSVVLTTNYNKITITRKATKSLANIEKVFVLLKRTSDSDIFITGDSSVGNLKYISSLEYDELSRHIFTFQNQDHSCVIIFSRDHIKEHFQNNFPKDMKGNEFWIGTENEQPILINEDTGKDRLNRTIVDIIEKNLSEEHRAIFNSVKPPSQPMFVEGSLCDKNIPIAAVLILWLGISRMLDKMGIKWTFHQAINKITEKNPANKYIKFEDGILEYESLIFSELILNGLSKLNPIVKKFEAFNTEEGYIDYMYSLWGNYSGIVQLRNFYEFLIDPITKDVCRDLSLPTDPDGLIIHAVKLLSDNTFVSKANDRSYRVRSVEIIPAILYSTIASQYMTYVKSGGKQPMTIKQRDVITKLIGLETVNEYSTLNPAIEIGKDHTISAKGYKGSNMDYAYDEEKRSYDPTSIGKIAISTAPKKVGPSYRKVC